MNDFSAAIDLALDALERLQRESDHPPRASRSALARLREMRRFAHH